MVNPRKVGQTSTGSRKARQLRSKQVSDASDKLIEDRRYIHEIAALRVAVNALDTRVTQNESDISQNATDIGDNDVDISDLQTDLSALTTRVTTAESDIVENAKGERFSEYRVTSAANINATVPHQFTFNVVHDEDSVITSRQATNTRIRVEEDGEYRIDWRMTYYSATAFVGLYAYIRLNGSTITYGGAEGLVGGPSASFSSSNGSFQVALNANDYWEMFSTRHAASTAASYLHSDHTYIRVTKLGTKR
jgi:hypothetical protein